MYPAPQATALLKGSIFLCLQGEDYRASIQNYSYCVTGNCTVFNYQYKKLSKLSNANAFCELMLQVENIVLNTLNFPVLEGKKYNAFKE